MSHSNTPPRPEDEFPSLGPANRTWTLFLVSVLGLFLELMLIRWVGTEIRIFAYLQNTVLVTCFLGLGMGCLTCRKPVVLRQMLWPLLWLTLLLAIPFSRAWLGKITELLTVLGDFLIWTHGVSTGAIPPLLPVFAGLGLTFLLLVLIWEIFVPLGRLVGRLLDDNPRTIWAYSVNVAGSLTGICLFVLLSALSLPPLMWFVVPAALLIALIVMGKPRPSARLDAALLVALVALGGLAGYEPGALEVRWSPYQKLVLRASDSSHPDLKDIGQYVINVNNVGYQEMIDLSPEHLAADPDRYPETGRGMSQYDIPYLLHDRPRKALIVGSGSGNDAAGALRNGVERVTAVDIDPVIIEFGRRFHPEHPYDSPKVAIVNDDARSYFASCGDKFDVISFGLLDSHTTTSLTNARLDHYVYTKESIEHARSLLADGGIMTLSFFVQKPFVADRMARTLAEAFGREPIRFHVQPSEYGRGGVIFVAGDLERAERRIACNPRLAELIAGWNKLDPVALSGTTRLATDDWPYIYLEKPRIPTLYLLLAGLMLLLLVRCARKLELRGLITAWGASNWHFFFLGAAFLLLEVQNISKASVVLGNTWQVNAVIISGILAMVLLSNLAAAKWSRLPSWAAYAGLFLTCFGLYFLDLARLGFLPAATKAVLVGGLTGLPMLFSGIVFIRSFTAVTAKDQALGANLLGALVGGLLQSVTFVVGLRALLLIVAALYLAALLTRPRIASASRTRAAHLPESGTKPSTGAVRSRTQSISAP
jgi:spermidine synthase